MTVWIIRIFFLSLCTLGGYAVGEVHPYYQGVPYAGFIGMAIGFGFGWVLIAIDEMVKGLFVARIFRHNFRPVAGHIRRPDGGQIRLV